MSFCLHGLATANPPDCVAQDEALRCARRLGGETLAQANWLTAVYERSGVERRFQVLGRDLVEDLLNEQRSVSESVFFNFDGNGPSTGQRMRVYQQHAPALAVQSARLAVERSHFDPNSMTHLVTVSCTGFAAPGVDYELIRQLNLRPTVERVNVGFMGCHGAINGLRVAHALTEASPRNRVLLVAVELCSLHYYYGSEPGRLIGNALFADGSAAVVGQREGSAGSWKLIATGSCLLPASDELMSWHVGDFGFEMTLGRAIPHIIGQHLRAWLEDWLSDYGLSLNQVQSWAVHPGGPRILEAVEQALDLFPNALDTAREVLRDYGNMSSPTVLFILQTLRDRNAPRPCLMLGFGPGLTAEAALWI